MRPNSSINATTLPDLVTWSTIPPKEANGFPLIRHKNASARRELLSRVFFFRCQFFFAVNTSFAGIIELHIDFSQKDCFDILCRNRNGAAVNSENAFNAVAAGDAIKVHVLLGKPDKQYRGINGPSRTE